jgi:hypothetical protein
MHLTPRAQRASYCEATVITIAMVGDEMPFLATLALPEDCDASK